MKKVIAIDISEKMINIAMNKAQKAEIKNIEYYITDILREKLENSSFDVILGFNILYLLSKIGIIPYIKLLKRKELKEIIESHGFFILETMNLYDIPPNYYIVVKK